MFGTYNVRKFSYRWIAEAQLKKDAVRISDTSLSVQCSNPEDMKYTSTLKVLGLYVTSV
jgi:hypothetical protein